MDMRWIDAIVALRNKEDSVTCPMCGSENVKYKETVIDLSDDIGFADVWCEDCKRAAHISRGHFKNPINPDMETPDNLQY